MTETSAATLPDMVGEVGYALRIPKELKIELERIARLNRRSLNGEIIWRLERSLAEQKTKDYRGPG
jgi:hypothetical protein